MRSSSRDVGRNKHSAGKKEEGNYARKKHDDKDGNDRSRKQRISRDRELYDGTSGRESRFRKGDNEEMKDVSRISYNDDRRVKRERNPEDNDRSRKRRRSRDREFNDSTSGRERRSRNGGDGEEIKEISRISYHKDDKASNPEYGRERSGNHDRYWSNGNFESHNERQSNDQYWSKYPTSDGTRSVRPHYRGKSSHDSQSQSKADENKESLRQRDVRSRRDGGSADISKDTEKNDPSTKQSDGPSAQKKAVDLLTTRTGGAYIPPAKLRMMQAQITDKSSAAYQRIAWEALKKSIHGHINKVNTGNITIIVRELFKENIVRGRGLLCRSIIQAQAASPTFTHVYAALVAVINSKFPSIGELLLNRLVIQFRRGFRRNDKTICISAATFIAHLVNQRVAHEIVALEILTLLLETPTDDSVEVAIAFLKECGMKLMEVTNKGMLAIFETLRNILHEGHLDKRVQYMIEVIFQVRKDDFRDHEAVVKELDLVEEENQITHLITLDDAKNSEDILNVFKFDPEYEATEEKYNNLRKEILDEGSSGSECESESGEGDDSEEEGGDEEEDSSAIIDNTETNLQTLRRIIYLTINCSAHHEECAHKLLRMELKPGQEPELCHMTLDCCAERRTYEKFYGLVAERLCQVNKILIPAFQQIFRDTYDTIHRLDTNKLRNVAKFFAHLLFTDAISWEVLSVIHLNEEETTSSSRIFIKILFQELAEYMGLTKLNDRVKDTSMQFAFDGLFPRDNPKNTRFAINFFTSIGLGGLTDELREHLKAQPKVPVVPQLLASLAAASSGDSSDGDSDSDDSSDTTSDSSADSSTDSDDSEDIQERLRRSKKIKKQKTSHTKHKNKKNKQKSGKKKKSR